MKILIFLFLVLSYIPAYAIELEATEHGQSIQNNQTPTENTTSSEKNDALSPGEKFLILIKNFIDTDPEIPKEKPLKIKKLDGFDATEQLIEKETSASTSENREKRDQFIDDAIKTHRQKPLEQLPLYSAGKKKSD